MISAPSINQKELAKFAKISHTWWNENGEFDILHQINPIRLNYIIDKITTHYNIKKGEESFTKLSLLDVGCGGGLVSAPLSKIGLHVTAIDALAQNIDTAKKHAQENGLHIHYLESTIEALPDDHVYDIIICLEVLEHIDHLNVFVKNLEKHLKANGFIIISTINRTKKAYLLGIIAAEYILGWVPKNTHDYGKFVRPSEIYELLKDSDIDIKELKGLSFNICDNKWQLSDDIDINYFMYLTR